MLNEHPSTEDLEGFLAAASGMASGQRNSKVLRHLLADCEICRDRFKFLGWDGERLERLVAVSASEMAESPRVSAASTRSLYATAFSKAERAVEAFLEEAPAPVMPASLLAAELDSLGLDDPLHAELPARYLHAEVARQLIERSNGLRFSDARRTLHYASLALNIATRCSPDICGNEMKLNDLRGLAWSQYASALRIGSQLRDSEEAGEKALRFLKAGTGDPVLRATVFRQLAAFHMFLRRFDQAIDLLREAGSIARQVGDSHELASTLVQEATYTLYAGEAEAAVRLLEQAIPLIDQEMDPYLLLAACHNLVRCYIDLDRPEQALAIYAEMKDLYREIRDDLIALRASWQEGQLLRDLGHPQAAETALLRARDGFLSRQLSYEVALVSLDLTSVYIRLGRAEEVRHTVETTVPVFRALGIEREELAALLQLQQVADQQQKALNLVRFLNSRIQPGARDEVLR